jgi:hypothetical protein
MLADFLGSAPNYRFFADGADEGTEGAADGSAATQVSETSAQRPIPSPLASQLHWRMHILGPPATGAAGTS